MLIIAFSTPPQMKDPILNLELKIRPLSHRVCVCVCMYYVDPDETARARGEATRWEREVGRGVWRGGGVDIREVTDRICKHRKSYKRK